MSCTIHIDNPGIFGPGDIITGSVKCVFEEKLNVRGNKYFYRLKKFAIYTNSNQPARSPDLTVLGYF